MQVVTKGEYTGRQLFYTRELQKQLFIYPTDTIYGIGCNALNGVLVDRIRDLKGRYDMPFSVIAPSLDWIREHCEVTAEGELWLQKLPGPYTLIFKMRKPEEIPESVTRGRETLGVRIPDHWISGLVAEMKVPVITTSANKTGQNHIKTVADVPSDWRDAVAFAFDDGELKGSPSTLVHLYGEEIKVQER